MITEPLVKPLKVHEAFPEEIHDDTGKIARCDGDHLSGGEDRANARLMVAAWNATTRCFRVDDLEAGVVEEMIATLKEVADYLERVGVQEIFNPQYAPTVQRVGALLAKVQPEATKEPQDPFRIRERRKVAGLNLVQIAAKLGVSIATVSRWERGESSPLPDQVAALDAMLPEEPK